jgi:hypothetical protein
MNYSYRLFTNKTIGYFTSKDDAISLIHHIPHAKIEVFHNITPIGIYYFKNKILYFNQTPVELDSYLAEWFQNKTTTEKSDLQLFIPISEDNTNINKKLNMDELALKIKRLEEEANMNNERLEEIKEKVEEKEEKFIEKKEEFDLEKKNFEREKESWNQLKNKLEADKRVYFIIKEQLENGESPYDVLRSLSIKLTNRLIMFKNILLVGLGGFLGTIIRFLFYQIIKSQESYPVTFLINVIGSLIIGIIIALNLKHGLNNQWKLFTSSVSGRPYKVHQPGSRSHHGSQPIFYST